MGIRMAIAIGIVATILYLAAVVAGPYYFGVVPTTANEWGDYFAGFLAPAALGWFVVTLLMQRRELELQREELILQRKEMELSRDVMKEQGAQQLRTAEATLEANKISASDSFADRVPQYHRHLDDILVRLAAEIPEQTQGPHTRINHQRPSGDPSSFLSFMEILKKYEINPTIHFESDNGLSIICEFLKLYREFERKAIETGNTVFVMGPYKVLADTFEQLVGLEEESKKPEPKPKNATEQ